MWECVTIDDKTLFVHLLVISVRVSYSALPWNTLNLCSRILEKLRVAELGKIFILLWKICMQFCI
jgi:hypothetical protein